MPLLLIFRHNDQHIYPKNAKILNATYLDLVFLILLFFFLLFLIFVLGFSKKNKYIYSIAIFNMCWGENVNFCFISAKKVASRIAKWLLRYCQASERYLTVFLQEIIIFSLIICHLQARIGILHFCSVACWQSVIHYLVMKHELWSLLKCFCVWYSIGICYIFPHQYTLLKGLEEGKGMWNIIDLSLSG